MNYTDDVPAIGNTGKGIVPGQEGGDNAKTATGLGELLGRYVRAVVGSILATGKHEEGQVKGEEEQEEHDGRA